MIAVRYFFIVFSVIFAVSSANAQSILPSTPIGKVAAEFVDILNTGNGERLAGFIRSRYSEKALAETPAEERVKFFQKLYKQSGGITPRILSPDSNDRFLVVDVKSLKGDHWARMFLGFSGEQADRLFDIGIFGVPDPERSKKDPWPQTSLTEAGALKEIERHAGQLEKDDIFSGVVLIAKGEKVLFQKAYGFAEKSHSVRNNVATKFNIASMNKMFTAVAIGQLVEAGKLSFDATIADVLPEYPNKETASKIKIRHLLTHSSGLGDFFDNPDFRPFRQKYVNPKDYFPLFASQPLRFEPGERFSYSNAGFVVLGAVIEKVSGISYFDYVREKIYKPAGMFDTDSYELTQVVPNLAVGYARFEDDPMGIDPRRSNIAFLPWKGSPAGGGYSTAPDLLKFAITLRNNKLLSANMRDTLITQKLPMIGSYRPGGYGYGFLQMEHAGKSTYGHGGGGANSGIASVMEIFADGSYVVVVLGNYDPPAADDLCYEIANLLARI